MSLENPPPQTAPVITSGATAFTPTRPLPLWGYILMTLAILTLTALIEHAMGRVAFSASGQIKLWVSDVNGPENSQQFFDWYSFSHLLHGFLFYAALYLVKRGSGNRICASFGGRAILTILLEAGWEILENSPFIINRYREATLALGYCGDSILNSMSDILCCTLGFFIAKILPWWLTLLIFVGLELFVLWAIRDNLTLNILMLIHPIEAIKHWQSLGAGATM